MFNFIITKFCALEPGLPQTNRPKNPDSLIIESLSASLGFSKAQIGCRGGNRTLRGRAYETQLDTNPPCYKWCGWGITISRPYGPKPYAPPLSYTHIIYIYILFSTINNTLVMSINKSSCLGVRKTKQLCYLCYPTVRC